jgi:hypothetical protein
MAERTPSNDQAAFGVFPQLQRNRSKQDREAAKNVPIDLARGSVAGVMGAPGDIESLLRIPYDYFRAPTMSELVTGDKTSKTYLPTSEDIEKRLPLRSETPVSKAATGLGILGGGFYTGPGSPLRVVGALPKAIKHGAEEFAKASVAGAPHVIKPKGGNWLSGGERDQIRTPEGDLRRLKLDTMMGGQGDTVEDVLGKKNAINNWIDSNLKNYVKKEMGTPDDPVRRLAEEGIIHTPLRDTENAGDFLRAQRVAEGFPAEGMGRSELARRWEDAADDSIRVTKAGAIQDQANTGAKLEKARAELEAHKEKINEDFIALLKDKGGLSDKDRATFDKFPFFQKAEILGDDKYKELQGNINELLARESGFEKRAGELNPFVAKLDPETKLYSGSTYDLGFDHIVDVLKEDIATGRIRPEQLNKVSMEQAVRRTYEYDEELAAKMNAARLTQRAELPVHKEYPEEGYKWVQLNRPGDFAAESNAMGHSARGYEPPKGHPDWVEGSGDEGRLDYGHGGWEGIKSGRAKVYSLLDAKGEPHVTIETKAPSLRSNYDELQPLQRQADLEADAQNFQTFTERDKFVDKRYQELKAQMMAEKKPEGDYMITQIKGKGNAKPKEDYLPYVQDFVRSSDWAGIGDLHHADMMNSNSIKAAGWDVPEGTPNYVTKQEFEKIKADTDANSAGSGMKRGGVVISHNPDTMMLELNERKYAPGGLVKGLIKAAKAEPEIMKASEALGKIEGRPLVITQADRTKVGEGYLGGPGFSSLQLTEPEYRAAEAAWGVKNPGTAKMILGGGKKAGDNPVYTTMIGSPTQHQSNQMVFDKLYGDFKKAAKKGELDAELRDKINMRLASAVDKEGNPVFPADIDILDKKFRDIANTFDRRSIAGHLMGGVQVGGKKGQIIDYDKIIRNTTDPALLDVPSGALGNRLFTLSGGIIDRPDLHPAFPTILQGEDLGVSFNPVARDILMRDFIEKTKQEKGRAPGYMDFTRGHPPSQLITEDILTEMQKLGLKKGGTVHKADGGAITGDDLIIEERPL